MRRPPFGFAVRLTLILFVLLLPSPSWGDWGTIESAGEIDRTHVSSVATLTVFDIGEQPFLQTSLPTRSSLLSEILPSQVSDFAYPMPAENSQLHRYDGLVLLATGQPDHPHHNVPTRLPTATKPRTGGFLNVSYKTVEPAFERKNTEIFPYLTDQEILNGHAAELMRELNRSQSTGNITERKQAASSTFLFGNWNWAFLVLAVIGPFFWWRANRLPFV